MSISDNDVEFALGIMAGESSFSVTYWKDTRRRYNVGYGIRFQMLMGKKSERLLVALQNKIGLGTVRKTKKGYNWTISSRSECKELAALIDHHLDSHDSLFRQSSKYDSYKKWKQALEILQPGRKLEREDIVRVAQIKESINPIPDKGRSAEEIIAIIEEADK